jgi:hypothetical protein
MKSKKETIEQITESILKDMDHCYLMGSALYCLSESELTRLKQRLSNIILQGLQTNGY